jgi:hypothetical protein
MHAMAVLACEAAMLDLPAPVQALMPALSAWLVKDTARQQHHIKGAYHCAAWAVGPHGARVLRHLWSLPLRHRLASGATSMRSAALAILDVALVSVEQAIDCANGVLVTRQISDISWVIRSVGVRHAGSADAWERVWIMAPRTALLCSRHCSVMGVHRAHIVGGAQSAVDIDALDSVFGAECVTSALRRHMPRMLDRVRAHSRRDAAEGAHFLARLLRTTPRVRSSCTVAASRTGAHEHDLDRILHRA